MSENTKKAQHIEVTPQPKDVLRTIGVETYRRAYDEGMSLSAYLEREMPSDRFNDGLDSFGRLLKAAGIRTRAVHGIPASTYADFAEHPNARALLPEWLTRIQKEVQIGGPYSTRGVYQSSDEVAGSWARPYAEAAAARWDEQIAPAIPISELVAMTSQIDSDAYRAYYLTTDSTASSMTRVGEGAEVPRVKLVGGERTIDLHKYGRGLEATYEQLRRMRVDKLALHLRRIAVQAEIDKLTSITNVMINGDGNSGTAATTHDLTTLDTAASAGTLTLEGWLAFKMQFENPYFVTTALARSATMLQLMTLDMGSANIPLVTIQGMSNFGGLTQINPGLSDNVRVGWTDVVPALQILAFDRRFSVERLTEVGASISEVEQFVTRQTQVLVLTEVEGYAVIDGNAARILDVNA